MTAGFLFCFLELQTACNLRGGGGELAISHCNNK